MLSLWSTAVVFASEPVSQTLAFGQLGILLVALVVLDLAPGPAGAARSAAAARGGADRGRGRAQAHPGDLRALSAGRPARRAGLTATISGRRPHPAGRDRPAAGVAGLLEPARHGDTGLGHSLIYYTNQSVYADFVRAFTLAPPAPCSVCWPCAWWPPLGVWAAALWHRRGEVRFAVALCGVASLLASPVSWLHHFVWIVPLALPGRAGRAGTPAVAGLVARARLGVRRLGGRLAVPAAAQRWRTWSCCGRRQHLLASVTALLGVALLLAPSRWPGGALHDRVQVNLPASA